MIKNWYQSKTIVANLLALLASFAVMGGVNIDLAPAVQSELVAGFMAIVNIFLRFDTNASIGKVEKPAKNA